MAEELEMERMETVRATIRADAASLVKVGDFEAISSAGEREAAGVGEAVDK